MKYLNNTGYLNGQLLIAMPQMQDGRFNKAVVYICVHNDQGAMGLIINRHIKTITFHDILDQLKIAKDQPVKRPIHFGGPVEANRGFVLHTLDYQETGTIRVNNQLGLTASLEILKLIADDKWPKKSLLALGYTGWGAHQLEKELQENAWLAAQADDSLVFNTLNVDEKWSSAVERIGISVSKLAPDFGHA